MIGAILGVLFVIIMACLAGVSVYLCVITPDPKKRISYGLFILAFVMFILNALFQIQGLLVLGTFAAVAAALVRKKTSEQQVGE